MVNEGKSYSPIEGVLAVLDEGKKTGTNKFVFLLALIDLAPQIGESNEISIDLIAEKVLEIHWGHDVPFHGEQPLRQIKMLDKKAPIAIGQVSRLKGTIDPNLPFPKARLKLSEAEWKSAVAITSKMIKEKPAAHLQTINGQKFEFLYSNEFTDKLILYPESKAALIEFGPVLRNLVENSYISFVSQTNFKEDKFNELGPYLFGADRMMPGDSFRQVLREIQNNKCVYTGKSLKGKVHLDHVAPWSRVNLSYTENFLLTEEKLNISKNNYLLAPDFLENWHRFQSESQKELIELSRDFGWPSSRQIVVKTLLNLYQKAPDGTPLFGTLIEGLDEISRSKIYATLKELA